MTRELSLDEDGFDRATTRIVETHDELARRRDRLAAAAQDLFDEGWRGVAADQYAAGWHEWQHGAELLLQGLTGLVGAMDLARAELYGADVEAAMPSNRLRSRLGSLR